MESIPKEDMQKEEEEPCTSYSHQGDKEISRRKTPSIGEEKEKGDNLTKLLPKSVYMIHVEYEELWRKYRESPRGFDSKANSRLEECEHATTHHLVQCSHMPRIAGREMEREEEVDRRGTLSDFLEEYDSQTLKYRDHLSFSEFCKMKVNGKEQQDRFHLSTFEGSPVCSAKAWVEELETFLQQHQMPGDEVIRIYAGTQKNKHITINTEMQQK